MRTFFRTDRRAFCQAAVSGLAAVFASQGELLAREAETGRIPALLPRDDEGKHFVLYSDCCSGTPGTPEARNLQAVNAVVSRIRPRPEFIAFPGDAVMGYTKDYAELRRQWDHWLGAEMAWVREQNVPLYQSTSNHNTYDAESERVFREVHSGLPQNGPAGQEGLAYYVRRGNLLYISTHQPDRQQLIDHTWLDRVLTKHADVEYKFVAGHYPVFPVNGYLAWPQWCFPPSERAPFWDLLVRHRVCAYLASHVIAFDVQAHEDVLQIVSGGAGTNYGPGGFMPGRSEYLHAVQISVDRSGLRYQVHDVERRVREHLSWPFALPSSNLWKRLEEDKLGELFASIDFSKEIVAFEVSGRLVEASGGMDQTLLCGVDASEGVEPIWIGIDGHSGQLLVRVVPKSGYGWQIWKGPLFSASTKIRFHVAFHPEMGPGGILFRPDPTCAWMSLESTSSMGVEELKRPESWAIGHGQSGRKDRPFTGNELRITFARETIPLTAQTIRH